MPPPSPALLFIVSGPAGSGKTTVCERVLEAEPELARVITCTTRAPREGEVDGVDYHFLDPETFATKVAEGEFYEHATVHGRLYGTLRGAVLDKLADGTSLLLNIDVQGAATFRAAAAADPALRGRVASIFIVPPDFDELERRLRGRATDDEAEIRRRLDVARAEMAQWPEYDYRLESRSREEDFENLRAIVRAERMRVSRFA